MPLLKPELEKTIIPRNSFHYKLGNAVLDFILRSDTAEELAAFATILDEATADVKDQLAKLNSQP